jgi:hypothetical protein
LRTENDELVVLAPLKPHVEKRPLLALIREEASPETDELLRLDLKYPQHQAMWSAMRARPYFALRVSLARITPNNGDTFPVAFLEQPLVEWYSADSLSSLYREARLYSIHNMLVMCNLIHPQFEIDIDKGPLDPAEPSNNEPDIIL